MMRSLWSGVTGLNAHQTAMDIEGNNIANVNTNGFKYSRANFSDLLSQTSKIATAPQGEMGGKNPMQVGLGTEISSVTRMFSQGSIQTTSKNTDMAIQGNGFFIVSSDGGKTYKYTRSGDFVFDANGNFVNNQGMIAQGWNRDQDTGEIDNTAPIANIEIAPGLTTPAKETSILNLKANLNTGNSIDNKSVIRTLDSTAGLSGGLDPEETDKFDVLFNADGEAFNLKNGESTGQGQGVHISFNGGVDSRLFRFTTGSVNPVGLSTASQVAEVEELSFTGTMTGGSIKVNVNGSDITTNFGVSHDATMNNLATDIAVLADVASASYNAGTGKITVTGKATGEALDFTFDVSSATGLTKAESTETTDGVGATYYFNNTEDLRAGIQEYGDSISSGFEVTINEQGKYELSNKNGATDVNIDVKGISDSNTDENLLFTKSMGSIAGIMTAGSSGIKITQQINAATHSSSIDVFDSLGTKHTVRIEFRKEDYLTSGGIKTGTQWHTKISVPEPGDIGGLVRKNEISGQVVFGSDGSLSSYTPTSITYTANNGSAPNQTIQLDFGTTNKFDGLTSFDSPSNTSGISQDGFTGGDLDGIRIDQTGTLIGSFTNGRSFGLAQLSMAKFTNNIGLESDGGNVFVQSANSGDPIIGRAASGGRGFIQSSSLEMSNVDLSRSLTQLIVVQRGYQANSKTITTSDQMLNTLLQLKQ
jgi:flagellar hook protein FlgE